MNDTLKAMVGTLSKSVAGIMERGGDDTQALLAKSYDEFTQALAGTIAQGVAEAAADINPDDAPMFKGLGAVGEIADLVRMVSSRVNSLKKSDEGVSEDAEHMLDVMQSAGELALRHAVNEHVDLPDEGDDPDNMPEGMSMIAVPSYEHPDDMSHSIVVKTMLPEDLAKFASDPQALSEQAVALGAEIMVAAGVPEASLAKAFGLDTEAGLAKAAPKGAAADPGADPDADPGADAGAGDGADDTGGGGDDPLTVLGRLLAAAMIQLDHITQLIEGGGAGADPAADPGADPGADPAADPAADPGAAPAADPGPAPDKKKPPFGKAAGGDGDLAKRAAEADVLQAQVDDLRKQLTAAQRQPLPAKGVVNATVALAKGVDTGGADTSAAEAALAKRAAEIEAMPAEQRGPALAQELAKLSFGRPMSINGQDMPGALRGGG